MKNTELIAMGLASIAIYMIVKNKPKTGAGAVAAVKEIFDAAGGAFSNGWRYFDDGTTIDPAGNYYSGSQLVYRADSNIAK